MTRRPSTAAEGPLLSIVVATAEGTTMVTINGSVGVKVKAVLLIRVC